MYLTARKPCRTCCEFDPRMGQTIWVVSAGAVKKIYMRVSGSSCLIFYPDSGFPVVGLRKMIFSDYDIPRG